MAKKHKFPRKFWSLGHEKLEQVMEGHGISKVQKAQHCMNPELRLHSACTKFSDFSHPFASTFVSPPGLHFLGMIRIRINDPGLRWSWCIKWILAQSGFMGSHDAPWSASSKRNATWSQLQASIYTMEAHRFVKFLVCSINKMDNWWQSKLINWFVFIEKNKQNYLKLMAKLCNVAHNSALYIINDIIDTGYQYTVFVIVVDPWFSISID